MKEISHLQSSYNLTGGQVVSVEINMQANVMLMDSQNYSSYRNRRGFKYYGGSFKRSPANIQVPHTGLWYVVVDLGGGSGRISTSIRILG